MSLLPVQEPPSEGSAPAPQKLSRFRGAGRVDVPVWAVGVALSIGVAILVIYPTLSLFAEPRAEHWLRFLQSDALVRSTLNTARLAVASTTTATLLGFLFAYGLTRPDLPGKKLFRATAILPLISPPFVIGLAVLLLFGRRGLVTDTILGLDLEVFGFRGLWAVQTVAFFPVAVLSLTGVLRNISPSQEWAARDLGHGWWGVFRRVTVPLALPGIASAALLVAMLVIADFGNPILIGGRYRVLSVEAYLQATGRFNLPAAAVICAVMLIPTVFLFLVQRYVLKKRSFVSVGGKDTSLDPVPTPPAVRRVLFVVMFTVSFFLILIYATIVLGSFARTWGLDYSLTLEHFEHVVFRSQDLYNSASFAAQAGLITAIIAVTAAYLTQRTRFPGKSFLDGTIILPAALPGTMVGIAWLISFHTGLINLTGTSAIIVLVMIVRTLPVGYRSGVAGLQQIDQSLDESSKDLGGGSVRTFVRVLSPLLRPAIAAAWAYAFLNSINTLSAVIFLIAPGTSLASVTIVGLAEYGHWGRATAMGTSLIAVSLAVLVVFRVVTRGKLQLFRM